MPFTKKRRLGLIFGHCLNRPFFVAKMIVYEIGDDDDDDDADDESRMFFRFCFVENEE